MMKVASLFWILTLSEAGVFTGGLLGRGDRLTVIYGEAHSLQPTQQRVFFLHSGFEAGQQIIEQTMTYEDQSDQFSAVAAVKFTDTNGAVYRQGCATATATRF